MSLRAVFYDIQAKFVGDLANRSHIARKPGKVDSDDRLGVGTHQTAHRCRIQILANRIDIGESRDSADGHHSTGACIKGARRNNHFVPVANAKRPHRHFEPERTIGHTKPELGPTVQGELAGQSLCHLPMNQAVHTS